MFKSCANEGVRLYRFSSDLGISTRRIRSILFDPGYDHGNVTARQLALWSFLTGGGTPDFSMTRIPEGLREGRARP